MKEFKGTTGPWVASTTDRCVGQLSREDDQSYGMIIPVAWIEYDVELSRQQANANLIAAAPDLLEALQEVVKVLDSAGCEAATVKAKAAISKALGKE